MIDRFVEFCLHRRIAVIVIALLLAVFGIYAWETLSVEAYPELGDVAAQVTTQVPGLAAEEVEQLITVPLEREINGTPGLLLMRSSSTFGLSLITVLFRDGYEDYWARQRLLERHGDELLDLLGGEAGHLRSHLRGNIPEFGVGLDAERLPGVDAVHAEQQRDDDHRDAPAQAEIYELVNH
ncbi:MAG TPA: efflux RND transporter permease subunit [Steroidobacteraceae bacterium]